jgi:hypothetical protein
MEVLQTGGIGDAIKKKKQNIYVIVLWMEKRKQIMDTWRYD